MNFKLVLLWAKQLLSTETLKIGNTRSYRVFCLVTDIRKPYLTVNNALSMFRQGKQTNWFFVRFFVNRMFHGDIMKKNCHLLLNIKNICCYRTALFGRQKINVIINKIIQLLNVKHSGLNYLNFILDDKIMTKLTSQSSVDRSFAGTKFVLTNI